MHLLTSPPETGNLSGAERRWLTQVEDAVNALIDHAGISEEDYADTVDEAAAARIERAKLAGRVEGPTVGPTVQEMVDRALMAALERMGFRPPPSNVSSDVETVPPEATDVPPSNINNPIDPPLPPTVQA